MHLKKQFSLKFVCLKISKKKQPPIEKSDCTSQLDPCTLPISTPPPPPPRHTHTTHTGHSRDDDFPAVKSHSVEIKLHPLKQKIYFLETRSNSFDQFIKMGLTGMYLFFLFSIHNIDCGYSVELPRTATFPTNKT